MTEQFDLLVIGAGMAGIAAASKGAAGGWHVGIVDVLPYGGTCALRGCDPKKILRRGAEIVESARLMRGKGVDDGGLRVDWPALMRHKRGFTDPIPQRMEHDLTVKGVTTLHGAARFVGPNEVVLDGTTYRAKKVLIASGARPRPLAFPGAEHLIDSTSFLNLESLPRRVVFLGGGFVSFEFAHIAARAGSSPVIIERGRRPLKQFDGDLVELLVQRGAGAGIEVRSETSVTAVERAGTGYRVGIEYDGVASWIDADLVVHGAGRVPELSGLGLEAANVASGPEGVTVAEHLQSTTNPDVYAAGDAAATAGLPITPVAVFEGKVAVSNMLKNATTVPDYTGTPTTVFAIPELTRVGLLEQEAHEAGLDLSVRYSDTSGWYSNYRVGETVAATKILIDRTTDHIVGAHMLGPDYGELVNIVGLAIKLGLTTRQLKSMVANYPTVGSDLGSML